MKNGTLLVTKDEPARYLVTHKVSKPGGAAHHEVHFAADPGKRLITHLQLGRNWTVELSEPAL